MSDTENKVVLEESVLGTRIPELMEFPSQITMKVIGKNAEVMQEAALPILKANGVEDASFAVKTSSKGNFQSLSITFVVATPKQMENLYVQLSAIEGVTMVI